MEFGQDKIQPQGNPAAVRSQYGVRTVAVLDRRKSQPLFKQIIEIIDIADPYLIGDFVGRQICGFQNNKHSQICKVSVEPGFRQSFCEGFSCFRPI